MELCWELTIEKEKIVKDSVKSEEKEKIEGKEKKKVRMSKEMKRANQVQCAS